MARSDPGPTTTRTGLSFRAWLLVILAAALLQITLVTLYYWPQPKALVGDEIGYVKAARELALGQPDPEPVRAPLYPRLLELLGAGNGHRLPIQLLQMALFLGLAWLTRTLTRRLGGSPLAADLAAALTLLYPTLAAFPLYLWPEVVHLGLWIGAFTILASARRGALWLASAGLMLALALLTRHLLLGFLPVLLIALWIDETRRSAESGRQPLRSVLWVMVPIAAIVGPVLAVDRLDDGRLRSTSNASFNLWVGLRDPSPWSEERPIVFRSYRRYLESADSPVERDRMVESEIARHLATEGWLAVLGGQIGKQYFRLFDHDSLLVAQLPGGRMHGERRGYKRVPPLFAHGIRWLDASVYALLLAGAAWGLCRMRRRQPLWLYVAVGFLLYNLLLFLGLHAKPRYMLQLMPFMALLAGLGIAGWLEGPPAGALRRLAATALAMLLLFLAFGPRWLG